MSRRNVREPGHHQLAEDDRTALLAAVAPAQVPATAGDHLGPSGWSVGKSDLQSLLGGGTAYWFSQSEEKDHLTEVCS